MTSPLAHVSIAGGSAGGTSSAINTTGANLLVFSIAYDTANAAPTVSDSNSNTWTLLKAVASTGGFDASSAIYYCATPTVGSGHTFTIAGSGSFSSGQVTAWSGYAAPDIGAGVAFSGTTGQPGSVTPTNATNLIIAAFAQNAASTVASINGGFTISDQQTGIGGTNEASAQAYLTQTTALAANPTWTATVSGGGALTIGVFEVTAPPHRYWRMNILSTLSEDGGGFPALSGVSFASYPGGPNLVGSGTATASSSANSSFLPPKAVSGTLTDAWVANGTGSPIWWQYDFGSGVAFNIVEVKVYVSNLSGTVTNWDLQWSDDNTTFTTIASFGSDPSGSLHTFLTFDVPPSSSPGAHRYWWVESNIAPTHSDWSIAEIQFRTTAGVPLAFSGGTPSASTTLSGSAAANAADGNINTYWDSGNSSYPGTWWRYDYGSGVTIAVVEVAYTARNDSAYNQGMSSFRVMYSDNGITFTSAGNQTATWSFAGQQQLFEVGPPPPGTPELPAVPPIARYLRASGARIDPGSSTQRTVFGRQKRFTPNVPASTLPPLGLLDLLDSSLTNAAYSLGRRLRQGYSGKAFNVRRASDNTTLDIGYLSTTSNVVNIGALLTFCAGTDGFITTIYDNTANGFNQAQATTSLQPQVVSSGALLNPMNGYPTANNGTMSCATIAFPASNTGMNVIAAIVATGTAAFPRIAAFVATGQSADYQNVPSFDMTLDSGTFSTWADRNSNRTPALTITPNVLQVVSVRFDGTVAASYINGTSGGTTGSINGTFGTTGVLSIQGTPNPTLPGRAAEFIFATTMPIADFTLANANVLAFYTSPPTPPQAPTPYLSPISRFLRTTGAKINPGLNAQRPQIARHRQVLNAAAPPPPIYVVQSCSAGIGSIGTFAGNLNLPSPPTVGNLLFALVSNGGGGPSTAFWTFLKRDTTTLDDIFYRYVQSGDTAALPDYYTASRSYQSTVVWEIAGAGPTIVTAIDQSQFIAGTTSPTTTPTINSSSNFELAIVFASASGFPGGNIGLDVTWAVDQSIAPFNNAVIGGHKNLGVAGTAVQSTTTYAASQTTGNIATFIFQKAPAGPLPTLAPALRYVGSISRLNPPPPAEVARSRRRRAQYQAAPGTSHYTLSDTVGSSDNILASGTFSRVLSDTVGSSDSAIAITVLPVTLADTVGVSETFSRHIHYNITLADAIFSHDVVQEPEVLIGGLYRQALASGVSSVKVSFSGLYRSVLGSAGNSSDIHVSFSGIYRKVLCLMQPALDTFGPIPVFPTLPEGFPLKISPVLDTIVGTMKSLREMRVAQQTLPTWDIELLYEELRDQTQNQTIYPPFAGYTQYMQLVQTWLSMYGTTGVFAFDCPWDDSRLNQPIGTGDGITTTFTVYIDWGTSAAQGPVAVGLINTVTGVYINGVSQGTNTWQIQRNKVVFLSPINGLPLPPAPGVRITMTFSFYYLCRWSADEQEYEEFAKDRWAVNSLKFRASPWL